MMIERFIELVTYVADPRRPWAFMQKQTGVYAEGWKQACSGRQRPTIEMVRALGEHWPQFAYWFMTGKTDEEHGHVSPFLEQYRSSLRRMEAASASAHPHPAR